MTHINIDYREMRKICFRSKDSFSALGENIDTPTGGKLIYIDNGSDVLAVAHLDSVQQKKTFVVSTDFDGNDIVYCPQMDDRLGVYVLLKVLPALGIKVDVLLTDDEEIGNSTAQYFVTKKKYNWMFQFDRRLDDVVFYQYGTDKLKNEMLSHGFRLGYGSFSDICYLDFLGCDGFNIGTGYINEHSLVASADMKMLKSQIMLFKSFYDANKNRMFKYTPSTRTSYYNNYNGYDYSNTRWSDDRWTDYYKDEDTGISWGKKSPKKANKNTKKNKSMYLNDYWYHTYEKDGELVSDQYLPDYCDDEESDVDALMNNQYRGDDYISEEILARELSWTGMGNFWDARENDQWFIDSLKKNKRK